MTGPGAVDPGRVAAGVFHLDRGGGGLPLVLVHGAGGSHRQWPEEVRALPGRRVIALDLPGHGASPPPASRSVAGYAGAVLGLLDALGLERAAFAGHSMGGAIALSLALDAPARVAALALVGTGARLRVAPAILQGTADPEAYARFADAAGGRAFGSGAGAALRRQHAEGLRALDPAVTHGDFLACDAFDVLARLPEIRAPTLVVCGTEDQLTPPKYARHLCDHIAGARLEMVPGAGHMVMLEAPGRVAGAIDGFLAGIG